MRPPQVTALIVVIGVFAIGFAIAQLGAPVELLWLPFALLAGGLAYARWGAAAWGVVAAFEAVVTYLSQAFPPFDLSVVFGVSALVSLLAAVMLARAPSARVLLAATVWAGLNLVLGLWAMPVGAHDLSIPFALLVGAAGLASYLAWRGRRDQG